MSLEFPIQEDVGDNQQGLVSENISVEAPLFARQAGTLTEELTRQNPQSRKQIEQFASDYGMFNEVAQENTSTSSIPKMPIFSEAHTSESGERMMEQGLLYQDIAKYLRQYSGEKGIADNGITVTLNALTEFFLTYGSEITRDASGKASVPAEGISESRKMQIDRFLLGDSVYNNRLGRLKSKFGEEIPEGAIDELRHKTVMNYIRALSREPSAHMSMEDQLVDTKDPFAHLQEKTLENLSFSAHLPTRELLKALAQTSGERFLTEKTFDSDRSLYEILDLANLKRELMEVRRSGTPEEVSRVITGTVDNLSRNIRKIFQYQKNSPTISEMSKTRTANCAGYALIASLLLKELDISNATVGGTRHAFIGYTTPDKSVLFSDFQGGPSTKITSDDLDRADPEHVQKFIDQGDRVVMPLRLSIGTPLNWWNPDEGFSYRQETVYLYREIDPGLMNSLYRIQTGSGITPEIILGAGSAVDPGMLKSVAQLKSAIQYNPDDPSLYHELADKLSPVVGQEPDLANKAYAKWLDLSSEAGVSQKGEKQRSFWTKLKKKFWSDK